MGDRILRCAQNGGEGAEWQQKGREECKISGGMEKIGELGLKSLKLYKKIILFSTVKFYVKIRQLYNKNYTLTDEYCQQSFTEKVYLF